MIHWAGSLQRKSIPAKPLSKKLLVSPRPFPEAVSLKPDQGTSIEIKFPFCSIANVVKLPQVVVKALAHGLDLVVLAPGILAASSLASLGRGVVGVLLRLTATLHGVAHCLIVSQAVALFVKLRKSTRFLRNGCT